MKTVESETPEYDIVKSMIYTCRLIDTARTRPLRKIGLTLETAAVLSGVRSLNNSAMPAEIAKRGARKPQTLTASINRMVARGLLVKEQDENKRNAFRVSLTPKGQAAYEKAVNLYIYRRIMVSISTEERAILQKCLATMEKNIKKLLKNTQHLDVI
jgi:DNA-binding MarR family transcriptional regulator